SADATDLNAEFARFGTARHRDWLEANERRSHDQARFAEFFREHDVLLCPVAVVPALPPDHPPPMAIPTIQVNGAPAPYGQLLGWIGAAPMAPLPAPVAPVGRTAAGLPVGIQIIGPHLEDRTTIDVARRLTEVTGGFEPPPGF